MVRLGASPNITGALIRGQASSDALEELVGQERRDQECRAELGAALVIAWPGRDERGTLTAPDVGDFLEQSQAAG